MSIVKWHNSSLEQASATRERKRCFAFGNYEIESISWTIKCFSIVV